MQQQDDSCTLISCMIQLTDKNSKVNSNKNGASIHVQCIRVVESIAVGVSNITRCVLVCLPMVAFTCLCLMDINIHL